MLKIIKLSVIYAFLRKLYLFIFVILFLELMLLELLLKSYSSIITYLLRAPRLAVLAFSITVFCWIAIKVIYATALIKINSYMYLGPFTGRIYMNTKYFSKSSDLIKVFMEGLLSIPKKYRNKNLQTNTHEYICLSLIKLLKQKGISASVVYRCIKKHDDSFNVLEKCIIDLENDVKYEILFHFTKRVFLVEKVFNYNSIMTYLRDIKKIEHKVNRYKVIIPKELLLSVAASDLFYI